MSKEIDNFDKIIPLLTFDNEDDFYHLIILKRKKENPELGNNSVTICEYYIKSNTHLEAIKEEIISICNATNARAMINLNVRSYKKVAYKTLQIQTEHLLQEKYKDFKSAFSSAIGKTPTNGQKRWIVDLDEHYSKDFLDKITDTISKCEPIGEKLLTIIKSKVEVT